MTRRRSGAGFTLIELLVVIAIIAILAAILFPVFAKSREKARQSSCQSNLKQLMMAALQYTQDYDEQFPYYYRGGYTSATGYTWRIMLQPYIRNEQVYVCPSDSKRNSWRSDLGPFTVPEWDGECGYNVNAVHEGGLTEPEPPVGKSQASIVQGAGTVFLTDHDGTPGDLRRLTDTSVTRDTHGFLNPSLAAERHQEGANYAFCDGHIKYLKPSQVLCEPNKCNWSASGK